MDVFSMLMRASAAAITAFDTVGRFLDRSDEDHGDDPELVRSELRALRLKIEDLDKQSDRLCREVQKMRTDMINIFGYCGPTSG